MGIKHLAQYTKMAESHRAGTYNDATNITTVNSNPKTFDKLKDIPGVKSFSKEALHAMKAPAAHKFGGPRTGAKGGQPTSDLGPKLPGVLNNTFPNGNAGRAK